VLKQIYYSVRDRLSIRLTALLVTLGINLLFLLLTIGANPGSGVMITSVVFSSLALAYLIIANLFVSLAGIHQVFSAPMSYHTLLVPVPGWKIILSRVIPAAVIDMAMMAIGISLVVWQSFRLAGIPGFTIMQHYTAAQDILFGVVGALVVYMFFLVAFCFFRVLSKSLLSGVPLRNLLSVLLTFAAIWVVGSLTNLLLLPFGRVDILGGFLVHISLVSSPITHFMMILVFLLQAAALFVASARLMERRLNV